MLKNKNGHQLPAALRHSSLITQAAPSSYVVSTMNYPFPTSIRLDSLVSNNQMRGTSFLTKPMYSQYDPFDPNKKLYTSLLYTTLGEEDISNSSNNTYEHQQTNHSNGSRESHMRKRRRQDSNVGKKIPAPRPTKSLKSLVKRLSATILNPRTFRRSRSDSQLDILIKHSHSEYPGPLRHNKNVLVFGDENPEKIQESTSDFYKTYFPSLAVDHESININNSHILEES